MTQHGPLRRRTRVRVNVGKALIIFAAQYPGLTRTLMEMIQNAIDAGAKHIFIGIDQKTKMGVIADDGKGASLQDMEDALDNVADTRKDTTKIGKFGIGMFSPLTECEYYTVVSWKRQRGEVPHLWRFSRKELEKQTDDWGIPTEELAALPPIESLFVEHARAFSKDYRTVITLHKISDDKIASQVDPDELEWLVQSQLGMHLQQKGVSCKIVLRSERGKTEERDIKPYEFKGEFLGEFELENDLVGKVRLELYKARFSGKRQSIFGVSEMPPNPIFPVPWSSVSQHAKKLDGGMWAKESKVFKAFDSGYFEGIAYGERLELAPNRDAFKGNDAFKGFLMALDTWYVETGHQFYDQEHGRKIDERYQAISRRSMENIRERILTNPTFAHVADRIREHISMGSVGRGHGEVEEALGKEPEGSTRANVQRDSKSGQSKRRTGEGPSRDKDLPTGVIGKGRRRTKVENDSVGLWIEVIDFENPYRLFEFDRASGRIAFNSGHPLWIELDGSLARQRTSKHDQQIEDFQTWVITKWLINLGYADNDAVYQVLEDATLEEALMMSEVLFKR